MLWNSEMICFFFFHLLFKITGVKVESESLELHHITHTTRLERV